jgi:hypothetical protein
VRQTKHQVLCGGVEQRNQVTCILLYLTRCRRTSSTHHVQLHAMHICPAGHLRLSAFVLTQLYETLEALEAKTRFVFKKTCCNAKNTLAPRSISLIITRAGCRSLQPRALARRGCLRSLTTWRPRRGPSRTYTPAMPEKRAGPARCHKTCHRPC